MIDVIPNDQPLILPIMEMARCELFWTPLWLVAFMEALIIRIFIESHTPRCFSHRHTSYEEFAR